MEFPFLFKKFIQLKQLSEYEAEQRLTMTARH